MRVERILTIELRPTAGRLWTATCASFPGAQTMSNCPEEAAAKLRNKVFQNLRRYNGETVLFKRSYPEDVEQKSIEPPAFRIPAKGLLGQAREILGDRFKTNGDSYLLDGRRARIAEIITAAGLTA